MPNQWPDWLSSLNDEDLNFLRRFLLHSGSLKAVASEYEVSYPTVRLRLDRLIQKVRVAEEAASLSSFEKTLRLLLADHSIDAETYKTLLEAHQNENTT
ncbi:MAG: DUF2089 family protein [Verrucomicrobiota bacterium]